MITITIIEVIIYYQDFSDSQRC